MQMKFAMTDPDNNIGLLIQVTYPLCKFFCDLVKVSHFCFSDLL